VHNEYAIYIYIFILIQCNIAQEVKGTVTKNKRINMLKFLGLP